MVITCPKCNQAVTANDGFCENCAAKIDKIDNSSSIQMEEGEQPQPASASSSHSPLSQSPLPSADNFRKVCKNKLCSNYNIEYGIDENYCGMCGTELALESLTLQAEPEKIQKKKGILEMPDGSQLEITPTQRLIGRIDLSKYISEEDRNQVSRGHITVFSDGEKYYVQDGKTVVQEKPSTNKTWLISGGQRQEITEKGRQELKDGDQIDLAGIVTLLFTLK